MKIDLPTPSQETFCTDNLQLHRKLKLLQKADISDSNHHSYESKPVQEPDCGDKHGHSKLPTPLRDTDCHVSRQLLSILNTQRTDYDQILRTMSLKCDTGFLHYMNLKKHKVKIRVERFSCLTCNDTFNEKDILKHHIADHTGEKLTQCPMCNDLFLDSLNINTCTTYEKLCLLCKEITLGKFSLPLHKEQLQDNKKYKCVICNKSFYMLDSMSKHIVKHIGESPVKLPDLKVHFPFNNKVRPLSSNVFSKESTHNSKLKENQIKHTNWKLYNCHLCEKIFSSNSHLKRHIIIHTGEKPYKCLVCSKGFSDSSTLHKHGRVHMGNKRFQCKFCDKEFDDRSSLKQHESFHTGERPYHCPDCGKDFTHRSALRTHRFIHKSDKPFKCHQCDKQFSQNAHLKDHQSVHTREKKFQCDLCNKLFTLEYALKRHRKIHTGEKTFQCQKCHKFFSRIDHLREHFIVHTGEKPFECNICKKTFSHNSNLKKHHLIHFKD